MKVAIEDLCEQEKDHPAVTAAYLMVFAHNEHETMTPAIEEVMAECPDLTQEQAILMWLAVNAKSQDE